jgi:hypothetical protein
LKEIPDRTGCIEPNFNAINFGSLGETMLIRRKIISTRRGVGISGKKFV